VADGIDICPCNSLLVCGIVHVALYFYRIAAVNAVSRKGDSKKQDSSDKRFHIFVSDGLWEKELSRGTSKGIMKQCIAAVFVTFVGTHGRASLRKPASSPISFSYI
jgi:hypothetical protein